MDTIEIRVPESEANKIALVKASLCDAYPGAIVRVYIGAWSVIRIQPESAVSEIVKIEKILERFRD